MKCLNKVLAVALSCIIILNTSGIAYASNMVTNSEEIQEYIVPVISNEYDNSNVTFYEYNGKYYLTLGDIKEFTRYELNETDTTITLTQGLRELVIDKNTGHLVDSDLVDQGNIDLIQYNGEYMCEGIPMLMYLGAACTLKDNKALEVLMPSITIWESIMPDYLDYYFDIKKLYGGEGNIKFSLACDIIADVLDGVSGHGLFADADTHLEDALYEILNVDMMKYESVQESSAEQNQDLNNFLSSKRVSTFLKGGSSVTGAVGELLDYYAGFYLDGEILKNEIKWQRSYRAGDLETASDFSMKINQQVYKQSSIKSNINTANNIGDALKVGMVALDTALTSYQLMQYDDDTRNLFHRTINEEMFKYTDYGDISWNNISDKISRNLSNNESIIQSSALNNIVDFAAQEVTEKGVQKALSGFTSKANIYAAAAQLGSFIASLINYKTNQAFSADMNAIWLNTVQYDIAQLTSRMLLKERDEYHFSDEESLKKLKDMFTLYYRTIIAFSENMAVSVDEFGGKNKNEWVQYFGGISGKSVSNYAAIYLYRITNCTIVPIVEYSSLRDELLTSDWLETFKQENSDIFGLLPSEFVFSSGAGGWATEITLNADGTFSGQYHDSEMGDTGNQYPDGTVYISNFNGKFTTPKQVNEYKYSMKLDYLNIEGTIGDEYYENNQRYIISEPYGFDDADEFMLYLPGIAMSDLPEGFISWLYAFIDVQTTEILPCYGIYNVGGKEGFIAYGTNLSEKDSDSTVKTDNGWKEAYKSVLLQHPDTTSFTYGSNTSYIDTEYTIYDIDKNGTPELIVKENLSDYYIYSFNGTDVVASDQCYWSYDDCLYEYEGNGVVVHSGGMGSMRIEDALLYSMVNNKLEWAETLISTEECSLDELYSFLDSLTPINSFHPITNSSYLSN